MGAEAKEKLRRFYRGTEGEQTANRLVDLAAEAVAKQKFRLSGFLSPYEQDIAETVAANFAGVKVDFDGGYRGAERVRAIFVASDFGGTPSFDIAAVKASWHENITRLSHRDVLGAVTGLGVERDVVGDIIATGEWAKIIVDRKMADFFIANLEYIGSVKVSIELDDLASIAPKEERVKEIRATVASLRADAIAAAGFGCSRSRAAQDIEADKLKLNWQPVKNAAVAIKQGDVLSMRGRGRVEVAEVGGKTKKGRIGLLLKRYI